MIVDYLERAASTQLYSFLENQRKTFDFGCVLLRDWTRPVIGQTLWKHVEGVDKDLRTMLTDDEADICLYVARDTMKAHRICDEAVRDYRRRFPTAGLHRLKMIWVPADFDADSEDHRQAVAELIEDRLARDVLLNVVLGNLTAESVRLITSSSGRIGLDLAILHRIATDGFVNLTALAKSLHVSARSLPERIVRLLGAGCLMQPAPDASFYHVSLRGRVFLELCGQLVGTATLTAETERILKLLGLLDTPEASATHAGLGALRLRIDAAVQDFGVDFQTLTYHEYWVADSWPPTVPRPAGMEEARR